MNMINMGDMNLIQMSLVAAVMILVIIVVRALTINKLPKKVFVLLWDVVLLRLLVPFSIPSAFSIYTFVNRSESVRETMTKLPAVGMITQGAGTPENVGVSAEVTAQSSINGISPWMIIWSVGCLLCVVCFMVAYVRCYLEFRTSIPVQNEFTVRWLKCHRRKRTIQIRQSDRISAPLTYGIIKPVILMPKKTDWENRQQLEYILLHEYTHICRLDMVAKLVAALTLCIHWFNPFVWAMYIFFNRDIELSCDERVIRCFGENTKSFYARTLITMEEKKSGLTPLYNSFSRNAIEERIAAIMKTKKITIGILIVSILVVIAIVVPFATSASENVEVSSETAEDYYSMVTSASAKEVEYFAAEVKEDVLLKDWESLSAKLAYPIQIGGKAIYSSTEFLDMDIDGMLNPEFVSGIDAESCREMFFNYQGIMMGETGQIWIASVDNGDGQWELKVIALNRLIDQVPLERVMNRVVGQGLENAIDYEKGYIGEQKDAVVKLCISESGKFEAYGIISPEYGQRGILLNNIIDGEGNWNYFDSDWGYGKETPEIIEIADYEVQFSYYREDGSWCELIFDTYETGTMSVQVFTAG